MAPQIFNHRRSDAAEDLVGAQGGQGDIDKRKAKQSHGCCKGRLPSDPVLLASLVSLVGMVCVIILGVFFQMDPKVNGNVNPNKLTPCLLAGAGYDPAIAVKVWDFASPQWFFGVVSVCCFILRRYAFVGLTSKFYGHLPANKQVKVANYMLEFLGTSLALFVCARAGQFQLLFQPEQHLNPDAHRAYLLAGSAQKLYTIFITMYLTELAFDPEIRLGLAMHHWTAILLCIWGMAAVSFLGNNLLVLRMVFAVSLYMSTEQNVFIEMLLYQRQIYLPRLFYASAWFYLLTRGVILVLSFWTWWRVYSVVFEGQIANNWVVYSLWMFVPFANLVLTITQLTTVQSLLGIAAMVDRKCKDKGKVLVAESAASASEEDSSGSEGA